MDKLVPQLVRQQAEDGPAITVLTRKPSDSVDGSGHEHAEELLSQQAAATGGSLYDPANIMLIHHLYAALRAHALYLRDQNYVVQMAK